jgi:hypothetical protein
MSPQSRRRGRANASALICRLGSATTYRRMSPHWTTRATLHPRRSAQRERATGKRAPPPVARTNGARTHFLPAVLDLLLGPTANPGLSGGQTRRCVG